MELLAVEAVHISRVWDIGYVDIRHMIGPNSLSSPSVSPNKSFS